jgi:hypothetical protein
LELEGFKFILERVHDSLVNLESHKVEDDGVSISIEVIEDVIHITVLGKEPAVDWGYIFNWLKRHECDSNHADEHTGNEGLRKAESIR